MLILNNHTCLVTTALDTEKVVLELSQPGRGMDFVDEEDKYFNFKLCGRFFLYTYH